MEGTLTKIFRERFQPVKTVKTLEMTEDQRIASMEKYASMMKAHFDSEWQMMKADGNHFRHNSNPDYFRLLIDPAKTCSGKALDFACGQGRNVSNLINLGVFDRVDGVDISGNNVRVAAENLLSEGRTLNQFSFHEIDGYTLKELKDDEYSYVMTTIALQHICHHATKFNIFKEIYRIMADGGTFVFQMGQGPVEAPLGDYLDNVDERVITVCRVLDIEEPLKDLREIGFTDLSVTYSTPFECGHSQWAYIKGKK
jgi:SAM-dependent methyltransferase